MAVTQHLVLPKEHTLSLQLASEVANSVLICRELHDTPGVVGTRVISPGLVELTLQAGDPLGYGSRTWPVRVGGAGLGDAENENSSALALLGYLELQTPVAVRFAVPIALHGVDDAGFCNASFWSDILRERPTLKGIAQQAIRWLEGTHQDGKGEEWKETERHAAKGLAVIRTYAAIRRSSELNMTELSQNSPVLFNQLELEWISPELRRCLSGPESAISVNWPKLVTDVGRGIYSFDLFSPMFCDLLVDEVDAFEATKLHCRRPNTMNKLGLVVNDIGLEPLLTVILERLIAPMCRSLYGTTEDAAMITSALDHHHSFIVRYQAAHVGGKTHRSAKSDDGSIGLDMHHDASEATLNVCLGRNDFRGGNLRFCGRYGDADHRSNGTVVSHAKGQAILHLGRQRHGADDIESGERMNLILWARNSAYRGAAAFGHVPLDGTPQKKESGVFERLCLSKSNDRDYEVKLKLLDAALAESY
jgi:hypothetical protein